MKEVIQAYQPTKDTKSKTPPSPPKRKTLDEQKVKNNMTRDKAIKILNLLLFLGGCGCPKEEIEQCLEMAIKVLEQESTAENEELNFVQEHKKIPTTLDLTPKTGHWIYGVDEDTGEKDLYAWTCSECGGKYPWQPKYCPNCGAKMESEG